MSWESKDDYCGCAVANKLTVKTANENRTGQYLEKLGKNGSIKATKPYGTANATPTDDYLIEKDHSFSAGDIKLGTVNTVDSKKYMLSEVSGSSASGQEPTFAAGAVRVEDDAVTDEVFALPALAISHEEVAQIFFDAFTLPTGTQQSPKNVDCELTACGFKASIQVGLHAKNGDPKASSNHSGKIVVDATIGQYGEQEPEVTPGTGWDVSSPLTCEDPDSDLPIWKVQLSKPLEKTKVQQNNAQ